MPVAGFTCNPLLALKHAQHERFGAKLSDRPQSRLTRFDAGRSIALTGLEVSQCPQRLADIRSMRSLLS